MAILIIGLVVVGFYMTNLAGDAVDKFDLYPVHKAVGFIVLMLFFIRVPARLTSKIPDPAAGLKQWENRLSHWVHILLYVSMFTMAASGYLMSSTFEFSHGISIFGLFDIPDITDKSEYWNGIFHRIHEIAAYVLSGSVILHVAGAIKHRFLDAPENDVLPRMI
jgi:cytochrome b561